MEIEEVLGEEGRPAAGAVQPLRGVGLHVGLVRHPLEEALAALFADVRLLAGVEQGVALQACGVGEGGAALLADEGAERGLAVVVQMRGQVVTIPIHTLSPEHFPKQRQSRLQHPKCRFLHFRLKCDPQTKTNGISLL